MIRGLRTLILRAAWAPVAVLVLHAIVAKTSLRNPWDFPIHFLGGASIAYFAAHALHCLHILFGPLKALTRYLFSFCIACTVGVFWEFGERLLDVFCRMAIQQTLANTMSDLAADASGALVGLLFVALAARFRKRSSADASANDPPRQ
jgi:hypothetical protein